MSVYADDPVIITISISPSVSGYKGTVFTVQTASEIDVVSKSYKWVIYDGSSWVIAPSSTDSSSYAYPNTVSSTISLKCIVTAINFFSSVEFDSPTVSILTTPVSNVPAAITSGTISPTTGSVGTTFTCTAVVAGYPIPEVVYQWKVPDGLGGYTNVGTGQTYTLGSSYNGISQVLCEITAGNLGGIVTYLAAAGVSAVGSGDGTTGATPGSQSGPPYGSKNIVYPAVERDREYKTYLTKFSLKHCTDTTVAGLFFNADSTFTDATGTVFVEVIKYKDVKNPPNQKYGLLVSVQKSGLAQDDLSNIIGFADITARVNEIYLNSPKVFTAQGSGYSKDFDQIIQLKVVHYIEDPSNGNTDLSHPEVLRVYLNNKEIIRWQTINAGTGKVFDFPNRNTNYHIPGYTYWDQYLPRKLSIPATNTSGKIFGFYASAWSQYSWCTVLEDGTYDYKANVVAQQPHFLELYATQAQLIGEEENYYHRTNRYLTDLVLNKNLNSNVESYMMQTRPEVVGMNYYDVQYQTPAATNVDIAPVAYLQYYVPEDTQNGQKYMESLTVNEFGAVYSTPINTGFRARMLIQNNMPHLVFLKKEPDSKNTITVNLNLWTHKIIANSDQEVVESVVDRSNPSEVIQIDSQWIQSQYAAEKILSAIAAGLDGFSNDVSLQIFGNPLIQVGDIVDLSYVLKGINHAYYLVQSVKQNFTDGLETSLVLNKIQDGTSFTHGDLYTITSLEIMP